MKKGRLNKWRKEEQINEERENEKRRKKVDEDNKMYKGEGGKGKRVGKKK